MRKIPSYIDVYEDATAGINEDCVSFKVKKSFDLRLAERISRRATLFHIERKKGPPRTLTYAGSNGCIEKINCSLSFVRSFVKPKKRYLVTTDYADNVIQILLDFENHFTLPLPPRNPCFLGFKNGYYAICDGTFHKNSACGGTYPGYQRYFLQTDFLKNRVCVAAREAAASKVTFPEPYEELLRCVSVLVSGYAVQRNLLWCNSCLMTDLLQLILSALLPQPGAVTTLQITDAKPDFQEAAESDCHAVIVTIRDVKNLSATAWKKLSILATSRKPTLINANFMPLMAPDADPEGLLKSSLHLVTDSSQNYDFVNYMKTDSNLIAAIASDSMRFLHGFINRIEPESAPDIDTLLRRPDPNDIPAMAKEFLKIATIETDSDGDYIEQRNDFCVKLSKYVEEAGGDPKKVSHLGIGVHLKNLGVKTDGVKLPGRKNKVVCLIQRKWKQK